MKRNAIVIIHAFRAKTLMKALRGTNLKAEFVESVILGDTLSGDAISYSLH